MCADSQLRGGEPTDVDDAPATVRQSKSKLVHQGSVDDFLALQCCTPCDLYL